MRKRGTCDAHPQSPPKRRREGERSGCEEATQPRLRRNPSRVCEMQRTGEPPKRRLVSNESRTKEEETEEVSPAAGARRHDCWETFPFGVGHPHEESDNECRAHQDMTRGFGTQERTSEMSVEHTFEQSVQESSPGVGRARGSTSSATHLARTRKRDPGGRRTARRFHTDDQPFRPCARRPKPSRRTTKSGHASHVTFEHSKASRVAQ